MFDPYRKWLGIQPKEQPPNYYRLLSVDLFESDLDVIEGAADRTMGFVRQYQSGEHAADAARILNELATARLCLLKPDKKAIYDASLKKELAKATRQSSMEQGFADLPLSESDLNPIGVVTNRKKKSSKSKSKSGVSMPLAIGVAGVACVALLAFLASGRNGRPTNEPADRRLQLEPVAKNDRETTKPAKPLNTAPIISPKTSEAVSHPTNDTTLVGGNGVAKTQTVPPASELAEKSESPKLTSIEPAMKTDPPAAPAKIEPEVTLVRSWQGSLGASPFGIFSRDGSRLVYCFGNDVFIVDTETGDEVTKLSGHKRAVWTARFSSDDRRVVSISSDEIMRIWDPTTQKVVLPIKVKTNEAGSLVIATENAAFIAFSSANDRRLTVVNGATKAEVRRIDLTEPEVSWKAVTPDLKWGVSNGIRNQTTFWNLNTGASFQIDNGHHNYCGYFTREGTKALLGGGHQWDLWDLQSKMKLKEGSVTGGHVYTIGILPEKNRLMAGLADGTVWMFDLATGRKIMSFKGHDKPLGALVVSPDEGFMLSRDNVGAIHLWRMSN